MTKRPAHAPEHVVEVQPHLVVEVLVGHVGQSGGDGRTGVEHHDVQVSVLLDGRVDEGLDVFSPGGVPGDEGGPLACLQFFQAELALVVAASEERDTGTAGQEALGDPAADATRASRDRGNVAAHASGVRPAHEGDESPRGSQVA